LSRLTKIQSAIYDLLEDGNFHGDQDIKRCIDEEYPDLVDAQLLMVHVSNLRKKISKELEIIREVKSKESKGYRLVRLLNPHHE